MDEEQQRRLELNEDEELEEKMRSLYIFKKTYRIRKFCIRIVNWKYFDYLILALILGSTIQLSLENPLNDPNGSLQKTLD